MLGSTCFYSRNKEVPIGRNLKDVTFQQDIESEKHSCIRRINIKVYLNLSFNFAVMYYMEPGSAQVQK